MKIESRKLADIKPYPNNPRINDNSVELVANSIKEFGFKNPIIVDKDGVIIAGHTRYKAAKQLRLKEVPVIVADDLTEEQVQAYRLADNKVGEGSMWDYDLLDIELGDIGIDMEQFGFFGETPVFDTSEGERYDDDGEVNHLVDTFIVPPFSVLDTRQGYWQARKDIWREAGMCTTEGRKSAMIFGDTGVRLGESDTGTSVFDPVLAEVMYRWFCPKKGVVFDPFAGGLPRGGIAYVKGLDYIGIDLSEAQVESNRRLLNGISGTGSVKWIVDNSLNMDKYIKDGTADMILTCPPYYDLEKYSDDPEDLSNLDYDDFVNQYSEILRGCARKLKENRFAVIVLSDVRDKAGAYRPLCDITRRVMVEEGMQIYNELILLGAVGSASLRARKTFASRKCTRTHQEILVMYKGDIKKIQKEFGVLAGEDEALNKREEDGDEGVSFSA